MDNILNYIIQKENYIENVFLYELPSTIRKNNLVILYKLNTFDELELDNVAHACMNSCNMCGLQPELRISQK